VKIPCYHGTSAENLPSILKSGLKASADKIWNVSEDAVYCYSKNLAVHDLGIEVEEIPEYEGSFLQQAANNASCALVNARKDCRIAIIKFMVEESELEDDESCPNMEVANCIRRDIQPEEIVQTYISADLSSYRLLLACNLVHCSYFDKSKLSDVEVKIAKKMSDSSEIFWDSFEEIISLRPYSE
jgi:hypothetical protein